MMLYITNHDVVQCFCLYIFSRPNRPKVYVGLRADTVEVAIKVMDPDMYNSQELKNLINCTNSTNVVNYYDIVEDENFLYLITGLCEVTLKQHILDHPNLSYQDQLKLGHQLIQGLHDLHLIKIIHRDLKVRMFCR